ncbi:MAG: hypothetical protein GY860_26845 [Desulfobacteraceae bacterium]|nr:hypothetical protein [Desulfobacteraceae bacterium]
MERFIKHMGIPAGLILVLPVLGLDLGLRLGLTDKPWLPFLAFPPKTAPVSHAPFSPLVFLVICMFIALTTLPLIKKGMGYQAQKKSLPAPLPWWGFFSFFSLVLFWGIAWTRLEWFSLFQAHTFFPLWLSLIIFINSLVFRATGKCPLLNSGAKFFILFITSAAFWWVFEYLNRFVANWYYTGSQYPALQYFFLASLSFSTVLPAVETFKAYLLTFDRFKYGFKRCKPAGWVNTGTFAWAMVITGCFSLAFIGIFPDPLFFIVWISPFLILLGTRILSGRTHVCSGLKTGNYTLVVAYGVAALFCGFFWELFNYYSLARWQYAIPYVQVFHLFEMPVLGYAGYLPFGLESALIIDLIME